MHRAFRTRVIQCVMATDMALHFDYCNQFKAAAGSFSLPPSTTDDCITHEGQQSPLKGEHPLSPGLLSEKDRLLIATAIIKVADISNVSRPFHVARQWSSILLEEFFRQGDLETAHGYPCSPLGQRDRVNVVQSQVDFIGCLAIPLYEAVYGMFAPQENDNGETGQRNVQQSNAQEKNAASDDNICNNSRKESWSFEPLVNLMSNLNQWKSFANQSKDNNTNSKNDANVVIASISHPCQSNRIATTNNHSSLAEDKTTESNKGGVTKESLTKESATKDTVPKDSSTTHKTRHSTRRKSH